MPLTVAVFLAMASLAAGALFSPGKGGITEERGTLDGPVLSASSLVIQRAEGAGISQDMVAVNAPAEVALAGVDSVSGGAATGNGMRDGSAAAILGGAVQDPGAPVGPSLDRSGMVIYTVRRGDNLSRISAYFKIPIGTIVGANPGLRAGALRVGQKLDIPGGKAAQKAISASLSLPNYNADFIMPSKGYNSGILDGDNAVQISNSCGTPVVAAAEGLVVPDPDIPDAPNGWNGGYGNFVLIEHPFGGVYTRYAHLGSVLVHVGDYVREGEEIGTMGKSGDATGCRLQFEVIGARNPFAR